MVLSKLDGLYFWIPQTNFWGRSFRYGCRILINLYVRYLMPIRQRHSDIYDGTLILSLTSFPSRIWNVWMTCATLLNQDIEDLFLILWLSKEQFPKGLDELPNKLLRLRDKGLHIRFVDDDLKPHKKYFYAMKYFPDNDVVTVDDDILYNPKLVSTLVACHKKHPNCVICNRGVSLIRDLYKNWKLNKNYDEERVDIMPTGIGGVLYPAHIFEGTPINDVETIKQTCLNGDDLWLNFMTRLKGHKVIQTGFETGLVTILSSQESALCKENIYEDRNDMQIRLLSQWAEQVFSCDFYVNI